MHKHYIKILSGEDIATIAGGETDSNSLSTASPLTEIPVYLHGPGYDSGMSKAETKLKLSDLENTDPHDWK